MRQKGGVKRRTVDRDLCSRALHKCHHVRMSYQCCFSWAFLPDFNFGLLARHFRVDGQFDQTTRALLVCRELGRHRSIFGLKRDNVIRLQRIPCGQGIGTEIVLE